MVMKVVQIPPLIEHRGKIYAVSVMFDVEVLKYPGDIVVDDVANPPVTVRGLTLHLVVSVNGVEM